MTEELKYNYTYSEKWKTHTWSVVGEYGGIHISATKRDDSWYDKYFGGVEAHYKNRPEYYSEDVEPHHKDCWLLNGPCWHDGTSLYFTENIAPMIPEDNNKEFPEDKRLHEYIKFELLYFYKRLAGNSNE